uniref:Myb-like domain-containing protein n=1 Tax=Hemiselmis andersenii TaxID=464988 RepID=A0A7S1MY79_HEMAN
MSDQERLASERLKGSFKVGKNKIQTKWEIFSVAKTVKDLEKDKSGLSKDGYLLQEFIDKKAGKYSTDVKRYPLGIELEDSTKRIERAIVMQRDGNDLHQQIHKNPSAVDLRRIIPKDEVIVQVLHTVGYEKFPSSGESLVGAGTVILTEKNIYFAHEGNSYSASGVEHGFGSTMCPSVCCCGVRGCCACIGSCKKMWGGYTHVAQRETRTALMCVSVEDQLMDVHAEQVFSTCLERKFAFYPKAAQGCCMSCCLYCWGMCIDCRKICDPCILNGYVDFNYDTDRNKKGALEQMLIKENKTGDSSFWSPLEIALLLNGVMRAGGSSSMDEKKWYELINTQLPGRTIAQCEKKHKALTSGHQESETCRTATYRAVYIPFKDAGTRRIREAVCIVDAEQCNTEDVYKFVVAANKLKCHAAALSGRVQSEQVNSMDESGFPSRHLRDKALMKNTFGSLLGGFGIMSLFSRK